MGFGPRYLPYLKRLRRSVEAHWQGATLWFEDEPPGSPDHHHDHYAFKQWAAEAALARGHNVLLYLDACMLCRADPAPLFEEIERAGYFLVKDGHELRTWASDAVLRFAGLRREALTTETICGGGFLGFDLTHPMGQTLYGEWREAWRQELNRVYTREHEKPENRCKSVAMHFGVFLSDTPAVLGSLGEEAVFGALCLKYGLERQGPPWYSNDPGTIFQGTGYDGGAFGAIG